MRLINCSTLQVEEFSNVDVPPYAILSHTWGDDEVLFADLPFRRATKSRKAYRKIGFTCAQALRDGLKYAWIDTCCIDKSSSAELSEAINSMFAWYRSSTRCYAYLSDVLGAEVDDKFLKSRWFTRGWTLQELLAPEDVIFYDQQWNEIGRKSEHAESISKATGIDAGALTEPPNSGRKRQDSGFDRFCIAKRMSWASRRETTRPEDIAYCLLGIFDVNMPLLYGEGDRAFLRLQEEIIKLSADDSILAWGLSLDENRPSLLSPCVFGDLLASSPQDFMHCADLQRTSEPMSPFTLTNLGLRIQLPLVPAKTTGFACSGLLSCSSKTSMEFLGIPLAFDEYSGERSVQQRMRRLLFTTTHTRVTTTFLDPRVAVESVPSTIFIPRHEDETIRLDSLNRKLHIIVNESETLWLGGYRIQKVEGPDDKFYSGKERSNHFTWSPEKLILTGNDHQFFITLVQFCFQQGKKNGTSSFSVFMDTMKGTIAVREGCTFSRKYKLELWEFLNMEDDWKVGPGHITVENREGDKFGVSASVRKFNVYDRRLFELNIEAFEFEDTSSD